MRKWAVWLATLCVLTAVNYAIWQKEQLLAQGHTVLLALAPVDPRSLMQGDYMNLRYAIEREILAHVPEQQDNDDGYVVVQLDNQNMAQFVRVTDEPTVINSQQLAIRYRVRHRQLVMASHAFFFQEGQSERYAKAQYGQFKVSATGEILLTGLCDEQGKLL